VAVEISQTNLKPDDTWTVRRILDWTTGHLQQHGSETARLDAEILLAFARGCQRIELYTRFDEVLSEKQRSIMRDLVRRRAQSEPVAYLVGHREFFSLDFLVTPDVFIPRPDTETLVLAVLEQAKTISSPRILDVGTGSGCIGVAIAAHHPEARLTAIDISKAALEVAKTNAQRHNVADRIRFCNGDLFAPLQENELFDIIVSNPPYITEPERETLQSDVRLHEPHSALFSGQDGLDIIRRLIAEAPGYLSPGGLLLMELDPSQADAVTKLLQSHDFYTETKSHKDLTGKIRVVSAKKVGYKGEKV
jgi:release factor glutamine methyltransferase